MKSRGLFFGLNYAGTSAELSGCINDVRKMSTWLASNIGMTCDVYADDTQKEDTTARGIVRRLYELAVLTYKEDLDLIWIHYSGHGSYVKDSSNDETDGLDECLVPTDYKTTGLISDDYVNALFSLFNPKTRVICVFDCCHSGTIGDVKFSWESRTPKLENKNCKTSCKLITLSGCLDEQVSMDVANAHGYGQAGGALTSCLLSVLRSGWNNFDVFGIVSRVRARLAAGRFEQKAKLCSSYDLTKDPRFLA